ncbi:hypothetical protein PENANT_c025G08626 [Penicillium antarcticum]|uniref:Multifunctional fusion protein n=1 Tax=Penicillium antarcticum TaxID=416450 RepID=A0A1V6PXP1_9EURO|nr:hypothetical protein PENANT_c025G08626 [Penicillium antarcticum]
MDESSGMDANTSTNMNMGMASTFSTSTTVTLLFTGWKTTTPTQYTLTLLLLLLLAIFNRFLGALKFQLEQAWAQHGLVPPALELTAIHSRGDIHKAKLSPLPNYIRVHGDENDDEDMGQALMLAVMTFNTGVFVAVLLGVLCGELLFARFFRGMTGWQEASTKNNWPSGRPLVAIHERRLNSSGIGNGTAFSSIPDTNTFINLGLNTRPTFFGCDISNLTDPAPLVVYVPNHPYTMLSNKSTFQVEYSIIERDAVIENGYNAMTMGNGTGNGYSDWSACAGCA